jgi:integrase
MRNFRDLLQNEGRAARTVNQILSKVLSAPMARAVSLGYIQVNPCKAVQPLRETRTEAGIFTLEQIASLIKAAPSDDWRGLILAGFYTGQRLRDLADLIWGQIDLAKKMIFWTQGKTSAGVAIPIHPDLLDHLLELAVPDNPKLPVFPSIHGKAGGGRSGLSEAFKRIMIKANIPLTKRLESAGGVGRGRNDLSFHSLRHSFNTAMANAGISQEIRQKLTGHRDTDTNKLYTHFDFPALKAAVHAVPSINATTKKQRTGGSHQKAPL